MSSRFTMRNLFQSLRNKSASHDATKRPNRARTLRLEALESRELLDAAGYNGALNDSYLVPTIVTTVADVVDPLDGHISLREAIYKAGNGSENPVNIYFAPSVMGGEIKLDPTNGGGSLDIAAQNITINAWTTQEQEWTEAEIDGETVVIPRVTATTELAGKAALKGVTIDGANINFKKTKTNDQGQAVAIDQPILLLTNRSVVTITGVTITNSNTTLTADSFDSAFDGVGMLVDVSSQIDVRNTTIRGARYYEGGAVVVMNTDSFSMTNVLVADNVAYVPSENASKRTDGAGAYSSGVEIIGVAEVDFYNCTIVNNRPNNGSIVDYGVSIHVASKDSFLGLFNTILVKNSITAKSEIYARSASDGKSLTCLLANSVIGEIENSDNASKVHVLTADGESIVVNGYGFKNLWKKASNNKVESLIHYTDNTELFKDFENGDYSLAENDSVAKGAGNVDVVNATSSNPKSWSDETWTPEGSEESYSWDQGKPFYGGYNGYDLVGNKRTWMDGNTEKVDIGAYTFGSSATPYEIVVTNQGCVDTNGNGKYDDGEQPIVGVDHSDDFNSDGSPNIITLQDYYDYIDHCFTAGSLNGTTDNLGSGWKLASNVNGVPLKQIRYRDDVFESVLFKTINSAKTYTIIGVPGGDNGVHGVSVVVRSLKDGQHGSLQLFNITAGTVTADHLILQDGFSSTNGGAICIDPPSGETAGYVVRGGAFYNNEATQYGGAVYVAAGGSFTTKDLTYTVTVTENGSTSKVDKVDSVEFSGNTALRGGAICNLGTVTINGTTSFIGNAATGNKTTTKDGVTYSTGSFGGAIYNAGNLYIGAEDSNDRVTFSSNNAGKTNEENLALKNGVLNGYSGGAIYNTTVKVNNEQRVGKVVAYNVDFTGNFAGKYGGAISNFATFTVENATFTSNVASAGGAVQTSGTATFTNATFTDNTAYKSKVALATSDNGGNGGAIFASGEGKSVTFKGATKFDGNKAANAGGAIDYISGSLAFDKNGFTTTATNPKCLIVTNNTARTIGGAMVLAGAVNFTGFATDGTTDVTITGNSVGTVADSVDAFHKDTGDDGGVFAPVVAVTYKLGTPRFRISERTSLEVPIPTALVSTRSRDIALLRIIQSATKIWSEPSRRVLIPLRLVTTDQQRLSQRMAARRLRSATVQTPFTTGTPLRTVQVTSPSIARTSW